MIEKFAICMNIREVKGVSKCCSRWLSIVSDHPHGNNAWVGTIISTHMGIMCEREP